MVDAVYAWVGSAGSDRLGADRACGQLRFKGLKPAVVMAGVLVAILFGCSSVVHSEMRTLIEGQNRNEKILQLIASPAPANPLCWRIIVVSDRSEKYSLRYGTLSLWPEISPPKTCFYGASLNHNAPLSPIADLPERKDIYWTGEYVRPIADFKSLNEKSCEFEDFRSFARAPYWTDYPGGTLIGDLRYDRGKGLGFSEFLSRGPEGCLKSRPTWDPPVNP